jgi:hypothetical protein
MEVWDGTLLRFKNQLFCLQNSVRIFTQSPSNVTVVCEFYCFSCQNKFFRIIFEHLLDIKWNDEHAFEFVLHLFRFFFSVCTEPIIPFKHPCSARTFFPERLSNHCQDLSRTFSEICTKFDAVRLSDPSRNHIGPEARLQMKHVKICTSTQAS